MLLCLAAQAQTALPAASKGGTSAAQRYFTDTILVDQNGVERRFYSDLIKDRVVIINAMYTDCKDSCPMMAENFARLQNELGKESGFRVTDVQMISLSVDPEFDTPARLKAYAQTHHAKPGWSLMTGKKVNVEAVLKKLGLYADTKEDHLNLFLIGNDRTGLWKKAFGMAPWNETFETLKSVIRDGQ